MRLIFLTVLTFATAWLSSCTVNFNFTGAAQGNTTLETLYVDQFVNESEIVVPYLAQETNQQLQDRFLAQSKLTLTSNRSADVVLSGAITRYTVLPVAIQGDDRAAQNRLTIAINIIFENNVEPDEGWEQNFSGFVDFDSQIDFTGQEAQLIDEVLEQITQDVFTKSIGKW
jgi:hypothetical protein